MTAPNGACCGPVHAANVHRDCPRTWDDGGRVRVCGCSEPTCPCGQANAGIALQVRGNDVSERYDGGSTKDGPGDSLLAQRAEVPGPRPTLRRSAEL